MRSRDRVCGIRMNWQGQNDEHLRWGCAVCQASELLGWRRCASSRRCGRMSFRAQRWSACPPAAMHFHQSVSDMCIGGVVPVGALQPMMCRTDSAVVSKTLRQMGEQHHSLCIESRGWRRRAVVCCSVDRKKSMHGYCEVRGGWLSQCHVTRRGTLVRRGALLLCKPEKQDDCGREAHLVCAGVSVARRNSVSTVIIPTHLSYAESGDLRCAIRPSAGNRQEGSNLINADLRASGTNQWKGHQDF